MEIKKSLAALLVISNLLAGCLRMDVFEKNVAIKDHAWSNSVKPSISFTISDTASFYNIYLVIRHSDAYNYNNLWMNIYTQSPGDSVKKQQLDVQLGDNTKGWLGTGMDDIYEHRARITRSPIQFKKAGDYTFTLQQVMREDPLQNIWNVGIRIEREKMK